MTTIFIYLPTILNKEHVSSVHFTPTTLLKYKNKCSWHYSVKWSRLLYVAPFCLSSFNHQQWHPAKGQGEIKGENKLEHSIQKAAQMGERALNLHPLTLSPFIKLCRQICKSLQTLLTGTGVAVNSGIQNVEWPSHYKCGTFRI